MFSRISIFLHQHCWFTGKEKEIREHDQVVEDVASLPFSSGLNLGPCDVSAGAGPGEKGMRPWCGRTGAGAGLTARCISLLAESCGSSRLDPASLIVL